jgi:hypothetical protein
VKAHIGRRTPLIIDGSASETLFCSSLSRFVSATSRARGLTTSIREVSESLFSVGVFATAPKAHDR